MSRDISVNKDQISKLSGSVLQDINYLIIQAKERVAREYNSTQLLLSWVIGRRIEQEISHTDKIGYGEEILSNLASELSAKYGRGYSRANLFRMIKFFKLFPSQEIVSTLSRQLSWSHVILICSIEEELKREFYITMSSQGNWSVRILKKNIDSLLYERTAISKRPELVIKTQLDSMQKENKISSDLVFKDPYFMDFIGLNNCKTEKDLEDAILSNLIEFIQELGNDFCFVARQKRMSTQAKDRYLDLLFFHRRLRRLIAIELKLGCFEPSYKGQMEWYLNWLDKNERLSHEEKPIGIILCADKDQEDIEYLEMDRSGIHVAEYILDLPPKQILEQKFKKAIELARENHIKTNLE